MRIKRFIAADMRSALRMVREEQGAESVILSTRPTADGIEVVAATDYDEALVHQALRAATPVLPTAAPPPTSDLFRANGTAATVALGNDADAAAVGLPSALTQATATPPRDSFASRARAVFRIGGVAPDSTYQPRESATLAELTAATAPVAAAAVATAPVATAPVATAPVATVSTSARPPVTPAPAMTAQSATPQPPTHFEAMMAALSERDPMPGTSAETATGIPPASVTDVVVTTGPAEVPAEMPTPTPAADCSSAAIEAPPAIVLPEPTVKPSTPTVQAVAEPDPGIVAMREELGSMRRMIEREMGQFTSERLRGSPARAAAFDMLLGYGCDEPLAQAIAARIDPALAPDKVRAPMLAELARMLTITRSEPIDDGGVIALIGPTGAGKTTTVAKLAARFAARHRARDVAMVTTDSERMGAVEQLHAHGRRLGITVCESHGAEGLAHTLAQLQDYPLVLVDTAGYGARDRALLGQITWLRATRQLRSLLVLPASANPHDMGELVRRYRMASPEGVVLTKTDETGRLGAALSVAIRHGLSLAYTADGQSVPEDLEAADASNLVLRLEKLRRAADNPFVTEDHHAIA